LPKSEDHEEIESEAISKGLEDKGEYLSQGEAMGFSIGEGLRSSLGGRETYIGHPIDGGENFLESSEGLFVEP